MLHAELGRHSIQISIKSRMIRVWLSIVNGKESKLSKLLYSIMLKEHEKGSYNLKWILCINDILVAVGRPDLFKTEPVNNPNSVKMDILRALSDLYIQEWNEKANVSSQGKQYLLFKDNLNLKKKYLIYFSKFYYSKIIKYRTGNLGSQLRLDDGMIYHLMSENVEFALQTILVMSIIICLLLTFLRVTENCILNSIFMLSQAYASIGSLLPHQMKQRSLNYQNLLQLLWKSFLCRLFSK